jgi:hypothetical protein
LIVDWGTIDECELAFVDSRRDFMSDGPKHCWSDSQWSVVSSRLNFG